MNQGWIMFQGVMLPAKSECLNAQVHHSYCFTFSSSFTTAQIQAKHRKAAERVNNFPGRLSRRSPRVIRPVERQGGVTPHRIGKRQRKSGGGEQRYERCKEKCDLASTYRR